VVKHKYSIGKSFIYLDRTADVHILFYHAYVNAYISICECWSVSECRKVLEEVSLVGISSFILKKIK